MAGIADITIRRVTADDGLLLRTARLTALEDAGTAVFNTMRTHEATYEDEDWAGRAERAATGTERCIFLAVHETSGRPVGMSAGYRSEPLDADPYVELVWVWVAWHLRGSPIAKDLVNTVVDWARDADVGVVRLWVDITNAEAASLYRNCGFIDDTGRRALWLDEDTIERRMYRVLPPRPAAPAPADEPEPELDTVPGPELDTVPGPELDAADDPASESGTTR